MLQSFNGYLIFNAKGEISVKVDKRADGSSLLAPANVVGVSLLVEDVIPWQNKRNAQILIGAHLKQSEVRRVVDWSFSSFGNGITVTVNSIGGIVISSTSATLMGGSPTTPASTLITLSGTPTAGQTLTLTIDGIAVSYPTTAEDDIVAVAGLLAATINGHPILRRYIRADWNEAQGAQIYLYC